MWSLVRKKRGRLPRKTEGKRIVLVHEDMVLLEEELGFSLHQFHSVPLLGLQRKSSEEGHDSLHAGLVQVPAHHTEGGRRTMKVSSNVSSQLRRAGGGDATWPYLVRHLMSSSAAWLEVPITQSVRYSTILFLPTTGSDCECVHMDEVKS